MEQLNLTSKKVKTQYRKDGAELKLLNVEDLKPFFLNPVKWCDPEKLRRLIKLWDSDHDLPPIEVVEEAPEEMKTFNYDQAVEVFGKPMANRLNEIRTYTIKDGHHRWLAAYLSGRKTIRCWVILDE